MKVKPNRGMGSTGPMASTSHGNFSDAVETGPCGRSEMRICINMAGDSPGFPMLSKTRAARLHVTIVETGNNDMREICQLYEKSKLLELGVHPLTSLCITYQAQNEDACFNSARFMIIFNLLSQLNWDLCRTTNINLHVNHVDTDPRLELLQELPVNVSVLGIAGYPEHVALEDASTLAALEKSHLYLNGYL